jgi:hypothetical protein
MRFQIHFLNYVRSRLPRWRAVDPLHDLDDVVDDDLHADLQRVGFHGHELDGEWVDDQTLSVTIERTKHGVMARDLQPPPASQLYQHESLLS